jgi:RNA polymerase sigma-70 factor (ECF subfamily)
VARAPSDITVLLRRMRAGDQDAADEALAVVYADLQRLAGGMMGGAAGHTLEPSAVVHEAWIKIQSAFAGGPELKDRHHFRALASRAMRQVLINHARDRAARKRGGNARKVPLDDVLASVEADLGDLTEWNDLLAALAVAHERPARIVEMRVFGGMTITEVAEALSLPPAMVKADWRFARAWLQEALSRNDD